jgi:hypothetical protein
MSSGTRKDPIKPVAPVRNTRMLNLLPGLALGSAAGLRNVITFLVKGAGYSSMVTSWSDESVRILLCHPEPLSQLGTVQD